MPSYTREANGNINPSRFVILDTTADGKVLEASAATSPLFGISQEGTRNTPYSSLDDGYAAIAGENLLIYGQPGDRCMVELGGTVTRGDQLTATTGGKAIATTTDGNFVGAIALASGTSGKLIEVEIWKGQRAS